MGRLGYYSKVSFQAPKEVIPKTIFAARPSAPQENQCLLSHFLTTSGTQEEANHRVEFRVH